MQTKEVIDRIFKDPGIRFEHVVLDSSHLEPRLNRAARMMLETAAGR